LARLRRLWQPPRPHGEQPHARVVGPLELFYDLAVVVLVAQAAHHLAGQLTWRGLGEFGAVFTLVWIAWLNGTLHHELHGRDDARGRSTFLLQVVVLVAMGAFIPGAGGGRGAAFAVATAVLFAVLALLWLLASRRDRPEYRSSSRLFIAATTACAVLLAVTDRGLYRPVARTCGAVAAACLGVAAARPAPLILCLALIVLLAIPWTLAVAHRLASESDPESERGDDAAPET
jgi:low temperature requirement protein LtrA